MTCVLGLDLGGTKLLARFLDENGRITALDTLATGRTLSPQAFVDMVCSFINACPTKPKAIGIGFPGLVDTKRGHVLSSVILDGWADTALADMIKARTGCSVRVENDVRAAARAEVAIRNEEPSLLLVSLGTGISGALAFEGRILDGAGGIAGEIGHVSIDPSGPVCQCGRRGCLGPSCGGEAMERALGLPLGAFAQADLSDPKVSDVLDKSAKSIGWVLGSLMNVLNPSVVVFTGGLARIGRRFLDPIEAAARQECFAEVSQFCRFEESRFGYEAGVRGALQLAQTCLDGGP